MTTLLRSQTLASAPNSRLNTPIVPGPHTSCVIRMSALPPTLPPAATLGLPDARARIFSVKVISSSKVNPLLHPDKPRFKTDLNRGNQRRKAENARVGWDGGR